MVRFCPICQCTRAETTSSVEQVYMCSNQSNDVGNLSVETNCDPADFKEWEKSPAVNAENNNMDTENSNVSSDNVETRKESVEERDVFLSLFSRLGNFKNTIESPLSFEFVTNRKLSGTLNDTEQSSIELKSMLQANNASKNLLLRIPCQSKSQSIKMSSMKAFLVELEE
ncbi:hypothetical protein J3Q64DRAFT_1703585 [Phycomyces blakesleeanus]|uniref:Uncharacterized protein n=2 Tax=Phycomyces blakesleeanus TaxID=4837 RepID=A0A167M3H4_PHYB8|nr:hypothetical protein PHYBLDRAFT_147428 [Phycomyces blakesleeanus NRRL 1555(-)]OAD71674.1 hypothetical protein PHYBLDRAFT_147428 [Phycomyces blakesleeanus NRRL 1555(-)]|eukprot:XP_018289714.1 hypothetical protein PHYBLDRAFT_147428 [Phycomyces blakesleeanus NRRL 1555(-)]